MFTSSPKDFFLRWVIVKNMTEEELQDIAFQYDLDIRELSGVHFRLLDIYGNYKFDVYFKHNKKGEIIRNSILKWESQKWFKITTADEFLKLI